MSNDQPKTARQDPLLSIREGAKRLGVHGKTLAKWAKSGQIPVAVMPNGTIKVRESVISMSLQPRRLNEGQG